MRIALVSPLYESVPPVMYGGTERVIGALANELVARDHDVTLFAAGGSDDRRHAGTGSPGAAADDDDACRARTGRPAPAPADARRRVPGRARPLRHRARPHRPLDPPVRPIIPRPHGGHHARSTRSRCGPRGPAQLRRYAVRLHQRRPASSRGRPSGAVEGHLPERARPRRRTSRQPSRRLPTTWPSSGGSHRKSAPTGRSKWRAGLADRCVSRRRSTHSTSTTGTR